MTRVAEKILRADVTVLIKSNVTYENNDDQMTEQS
jgi:hypothetical protein